MKMSLSDSPRSKSVDGSPSAAPPTVMWADPAGLRSRTSSRSSRGSRMAPFSGVVTNGTISGGCHDGGMSVRPYSVEVPLRWSDMAAYGHVNNVQFLRLLEDARVIGFQQWFGQDRSVLNEGILVARHEIEYLAPLLFRVPPIVVEMWATRIGGAGFDLAYEVRDGNGEGDTVYARAE